MLSKLLADHSTVSINTFIVFVVQGGDGYRDDCSCHQVEWQKSILQLKKTQSEREGITFARLVNFESKKHKNDGSANDNERAHSLKETLDTTRFLCSRNMNENCE